jgi:tripartite-type tricarboxylate transporter receptor subunit TctC
VQFIESWKKKTGADMVRVPFKGGGHTVANMLSGTTPIGFLGLANLLSHIRAGTITPILVDSDKRVSLIPQVATLGELGFSRDHTRAFFGLLAPGGTPRPIVDKVRAEVIAIVKEPAFMEKQLIARALDPILNTPEEFRAYLVGDRMRAEKIVKAAGLGPK